MKEKIYTIPVNEAFDKDTECPFCEMRKKLNEDALRYTLGSSYMEEDVREETDKIGFCSNHYKEMYDAQNRLGLALILSTHLHHINKNLEKLLDKDIKNLGSDSGGIFKNRAKENSKSGKYLDDISSECFICNKVESSMKRYTDTFFYLWRTESEFKSRVLNCKGFCLEHFNYILRVGKDKLNTELYKEFYEDMVKIQMSSLKRVEEDILWFIQKFDYRFKDEPWKSSKDALQRAIQKVSSCLVEKENSE